jgi:small subunit ribosomal protein S16
VAVKIRLLRMGKIRNPQYRIVVANSRTKRDGKAIEFIGIYQPKEDPSIIEVNSDRVQHWLSVGAQPSEPVQRLLEKTGDWQKFRGLPAPPPLKMAPARADRKALYEAEAQASAGLAPAPEARPAKKAPARAAKAAEPKTEAPATGAPASASPSAEAPASEAPAPASASAEAPASEAAAAADAPATEAPATEAPATEAAATEAPAAPTAAAAEPTEGVTDAAATEQD